MLRYVNRTNYRIALTFSALICYWLLATACNPAHQHITFALYYRTVHSGGREARDSYPQSRYIRVMGTVEIQGENVGWIVVVENYTEITAHLDHTYKYSGTNQRCLQRRISDMHYWRISQPRTCVHG